MPSNQVEAVLARLEFTQDDARARLFDLLRIPSISAQPAHAGDCGQAARWLAHEFAAIGFTTEIRETAGHPIVIGHYPGPESAAGQSLPRGRPMRKVAMLSDPSMWLSSRFGISPSSQDP